MAKETYIRLRCTEEFKAQAEKLASKDNRTLSNYIENLLKKEIEKMGKTVFGDLNETGVVVGYDNEGKLFIADNTTVEEFDGTEEEAIEKAKNLIEEWNAEQ